MSVKATEIKRGMAVEYEGSSYVVVSAETVAKGNWRSYIVFTLRNMDTGQLNEVRVRTNEQFEQLHVERKPMEYLYSTGSEYVFMDNETYEQIELDESIVGDDVKYLKPNTVVEVTYVSGRLASLALPDKVELEVVDTPPAIKGATATNQNKEATLETGLKVRVPPFITIGEVIRVDTRSGDYVERVKEG